MPWKCPQFPDVQQAKGSTDQQLWPNTENSDYTEVSEKAENEGGEEKTHLGKLRCTTAMTGTHTTFLSKSYSSRGSELSYKSKHLRLAAF